jgi:predicted RNA-binding protein with PIN domain
MIVLIDGYNVIKQVLGVKRLSHTQRDAFVGELVRYFQQRHIDGKVIFDGGDTSYPFRVQKGSIEIVFSGYKESADDVILRYLDELKGHQVVLVSSDRALRDYAHMLGKESIKADEFYRRYVKSSSAQCHAQHANDHEAHKLSREIFPELDALMQEHSSQMRSKDGDAVHTEKSARIAHQKISKKERRRQRVIKKLE